jgi:hypothetical protein
MAGLSLPQGGGFWEMAQRHRQNAIQSYEGQRPKQETEFNAPGKTVGGGLAAGAGMGMAGYTIGSSMAAGGAAGSSAGPWGAAIGAGVGILAYLLS